MFSDSITRPERRDFSPVLVSTLSTSGAKPIATTQSCHRDIHVPSLRRTRLAPKAPLRYIRVIQRAKLAVAGAERGLDAPSYAPFSREKGLPPQILSKGRR